MLVLCHESDTDVRYGLKSNSSYTFGRVGTDFVLAKDTSVSRNHGQIRVTAEGKVLVKDIGSKYGVYVGERAVLSSSQNHNQTDRLKPNEEKEMLPGEKIRFGLLSSLFQLHEMPLVITTSTLANAQRSKLRECMDQLKRFSHKALLSSNWRSDISHVVTPDQAPLTIKVANAMAKGVPIVTSAFLHDFLHCVESHQRLPDAKKYVPTIKEASLNASEVSLDINPSRSKLFNGKCFVFTTAEQCGKYDQAIVYAGGKTMLINDAGFKAEKIHPEDTLVVNNPDCSDKRYLSAMKILKSQDASTIQEGHIALALLFSSCSMYCNPKFKFKVINTPQTPSQSKKNTTLVKETQSQLVSEQISTLSSAPVPASPLVIPETARSSAPPTQFVIPETARSSQPPRCTSDTVRVVESEPAVGDDSQVETQESSNTERITEIPETAPPRSSNESASPVPPQTSSLKSPTKIKQSMSNLFDDDDDDIFNFDEKEEPEKQPNVAKPIKMEDLNVSKKRRRSDSSADPNNAAPPKKAFLSVAPEKSIENVSPKKPMRSFNTNGFLCKSYIKSTGASVKSEIPEDELTRSFITLEVRPLVVVKPSNQSVIEKSTSNDVKNVKRFRKQTVATSFRPITCLSMSQAKPIVEANMSRDENEDQEEEEVSMFSTSARAVDDAEEMEDLWNFDSQSVSASRKRKR